MVVIAEPDELKAEGEKNSHNRKTALLFCHSDKANKFTFE